MAFSLRARLTVIYGALFLFAGASLLLVNYVLVRNSLRSDRVVATVRAPGPEPATEVVVPGAPAARFPLIVEGRPASIEQFEERLRDDALQTLLLQSGQALVGVAVASVGLGWFVAGRALKPLHDITATARRLSGENLHERIALEGPRDELRELADTFDAMLDRLERAFDSQRRFVANASHELRTPLAVIRTEVDVALADPAADVGELRAMAERVRAATERSDRLIDSLLVLARSDRGIEGAGEIDVVSLAQDALDQLRSEAARRRIQLRFDASPATIVGARPLVERLVGNLVENAIRHNVDGGSVDVAVFARDGTAVVRVANTGARIPPDAVDGLFEPFRRLAPDRTRTGDRGVGLGLSIVRSVARAHGGTASARARADGGLEVEVVLPTAPGGAVGA